MPRHRPLTDRQVKQIVRSDGRNQWTRSREESASSRARVLRDLLRQGVDPHKALEITGFTTGDVVDIGRISRPAKKKAPKKTKTKRPASKRKPVEKKPTQPRGFHELLMADDD